MNKVYLEILRNRIYIKSDQRDKELCKQLSGSRWDKNKSMWHCPVSWAHCKTARAIFGDRLEIGPELLAWAKNEVETRVKPCLELRDLKDFTEMSLHGFDDLRPFQRAGAAFLVTSKNAILGDLVGSGKTVQAVVAARKISKGRKLVVCPGQVRIPWEREIKKWSPGSKVFVVSGTATARNKIFQEAFKHSDCWVIINWEAIRLHSRLAPYGAIALTEKEKQDGWLNHFGFELVIADEAHKMKDPRSKQTRAMWSIAHGSTVEYRWALTGTPLTKAPDTLWPILHMIDKNEWPVKSSFIDRYTLNVFNAWGGLEVWGIKPEMEDEFQAIFQPRFRRMPKEVVLPQLPPIVRQVKYLTMGPKQAKAYKTMSEKLFHYDAETENTTVAENPISKLTRLCQFSSAYGEVIDENGSVRLSDTSCKLDQLMEDLPEFIEDGEGVVVFAVSRQLIQLASKRLEKANIKHSVIEGGQSIDVRQKAIDDFQDRKVPVILVVIAAGGVGVTLTTGRIGIFLQRSWSNVDMIQAEGRIHRIGSEQHSSIVIVDYITENTVEMEQPEVLKGKADMLEQIVQDKQSLKKMLGI